MSKRKRPVLVIDPEDLSDGRSESDSIPGDTSNTAIPSRDDDASDTSSGESLPQPFQRRKGDGLREADGRHNGEIGASMREVNGRLKGESGDGRPANDIRVERKKFGYVTERIEGQGGPFMAVQAAGEESTTPPVEMDDLDAIAAAIPCDTLAAVLFLRSSFPASISKVASSLPPFALLSQIYTVVPHRTTVDRQIEMLQKSASVRVIRLMSSRSDFAVLLSEDYSQAVETAKEQFLQRKPSDAGPLLQHRTGTGTKRSARSESSRHKYGKSESGSSQVAVFDWFRDRVLPGCSDHGISRQQLEKILSNGGKSPITDTHICILVQAGLLGRSEVVGMLQRSRFGELLRSKLEARKKRTAVIPIPFILRDLVGQGRVTKVDSTVGEVLRLCSWKRYNH
ncbi:hypothetical protein CLOM_g5938 [Closterium sp. NIES-68]|nr:hypothetical protein CLOM_g3459 [Closterium sp. NIES-68]GJP46677.1 hypothetical protein CLOM_g5938 [Closterium sp. NIES-68]GJP63276.1 hypothetical protein CLOP_g20332 [Closterium sp. NIES-67]